MLNIKLKNTTDVGKNGEIKGHSGVDLMDSGNTRQLYKPGVRRLRSFTLDKLEMPSRCPSDKTHDCVDWSSI